MGMDHPTRTAMMSSPHSQLKLGCCLLAVTCWLPATLMAGRYPAVGTQTFDGGPLTNLGDGSAISSNNTGTDGNPAAVVVNGLLRLTQRGLANTTASFKLPDLDPGLEGTSWDTTLQVRMDRQSIFTTPADGWALNVGPIPAGDGSGEGGFVMAGGLVIAFDTYNNGGDAPSIEIFANGISVGNFPQSFQFSTSTYRNLAVHWDASGLDVTYTVNTTPVAICTNLPTPGYLPEAGHRFAFTARTGGSSEGVYLDNLVVATVAGLPLETGGPVISEFAADNGGVIEDENGDSSDWIEIYNGKSTASNLAGWTLTDTSGTPGTWVFPNVSIPAYGYLTVFASSKNRNLAGYPLHTDFSLSKTGGYLALVTPGGVLASTFNYGQQVEEATYGLLASAGSFIYGYLETPTPGSRNTGLQAAGPPAEDVVFLKDGQVTAGGLFATNFNLAVQAPLAAGSVVRYTLDNTPPGETSASYAAPLPISVTKTMRARVVTPGFLPGPISSRTFVQLDASLTNYHSSGQPFSSNLPIVVMDSFGVPVDSYIDSSQARPYRLTYSVVIDQNPLAAGVDANRAQITGPVDFQGRSGTHVRGESSTGFPQKSYALELWNNDNEDKDAAILGMPAESDWVLHAPYTDKAMMRNYLVYDRMRALNGKAAAMGVKFVEVFFNQDGGTLGEGDYRGVYLLVEKIKRGGDRVDIEKLNEFMTDPAVISGGYIFKKDKVGIGNVSFTTTTNAQTFQFVDPEVPNAEQKAYLTGYMNHFEAALNGANFADPATGYAAYINPLSFVDNQWFVEITKQIDGYRLSTYFHKDRNGKLSCSPVWDYNLSSYNANYNGGDVHTGWYYQWPELSSADYYYWPRLHQDPNYKILHWDRYWELRRSLFAANTLLSGMDGIASRLVNGSTLPVTNSMANQAPLAENPAMRQFRKWPILATNVWPNPATYANRTKYWNGPTLAPTAYTAADNEVDAMKSFLQQRLAWIDDQNFVGTTIYRPPLLSLNGGRVEAGTTLTVTRYSGAAPAGYTYATGGTLYYTTDDSDPRSNTGAAVGIPYGIPVVLNRSATVKARLLANGSWSPLTTADFIVDAAPASPANLVISEFCYKPAAPAPGTPEYLAGFISGNNFEYVELLNVSGGNVDLTGCQLAGGISFDFAGLTQSQLTLAPGARVLVVGNEAAFAMRYGSGLTGQVLGAFAGNLSNSGETFSVLAANTSVIASVTYGVTDPWPLAAQTFGYSLVLSRPAPNPTYEVGQIRASMQAGGTPGGAAGFPATVVLSALDQVHNGNPLTAHATTDPVGLAVGLSYNGAEEIPTLAGSYEVIATVADPDYLGSGSGTLRIFDHASPRVPITALELATVHAGYGTAVSSAPIEVANDAGLRLDLSGSAPPSGLIGLTPLAGIAPGGTGIIAATLTPGHAAGRISGSMTYTFADDSTLEGASANLGAVDLQVTGQVYSGDMVWNGGSGSWSDSARWDDLDAEAVGVHAGPGLDGGFTGIDGATFGGDGAIVTLNGVSPNLNRLTFLSRGHAVLDGAGGGGLVMAGSNPVLISHGANTLSAPVRLDSDLTVMLPEAGDVLTVAGALGSAGGDRQLTLSGGGTLMLAGSLTGGVHITGGTLAGAGSVVGEVAVAASGMINPGSVGGVGTLAVGAATLSGTLVCDLGPTVCDTLTVLGALELNGATLSFNLLGVPEADSYVVATYVGAAPSFTTIVNFPVGYQLDDTLAGSIRLLKVVNYDSWATRMGLDASNHGAEQNPSGDGVANLLKFVLNGDPLMVCPAILPKAATDAAGNLIFRFVRRSESVVETTQVFETSTNLADWSAVTIPASSNGMVEVVPDGSGPGLERVTITVPRAGDGNLYGRLRVHQ